ncbi:PEP/pyruvate-binding domain-containing protein [Clostridium ihumii]|uniref:PEP/pyruvate-binding domain-containing protein n=1 Tax=Clostridium ihumii TaxID=1470356 RepID=UPI00058BECB9|nr:PEP/pyruvate-binding domain-containing protein [Clostridium ihumii]
MISNNIIDIRDVKENQLDIVGGKGVNLGIMISNNIQVPDGFIITAYAYKNYLEYNGILKDIEEKINKFNENDIELELEKIRENILNGEFSNNIKQEILKKYDRFSIPIHVAVRSSATAEDLPEASFAGQQETYLNVTKKEELLLSIKKCYASLWSNRSFLYRTNNNFNHLEVSIAVVVQEMVNSEVSGVLFTANPSTGSNEMIIDASYGLGEAIVSGKVNPDNYVLDSDGKEIHTKIGNKKISIVYSENGTKEIDNSNKMREERCLSKDNLKDLFSVSMNIKKLYKKPMDIEWAIKNNRVYILQARPITTIKKVKKPQKKYSDKEKKYLNNMIEHFPVHCYPLDYEIAMILQNMKFELFKEVGINLKSPIYMDNDGIIQMNKIKFNLNFKILKFPSVYRDYKNNLKNMEEGEKILNFCNIEINRVEKELYSNKCYSLSKINEYINFIIKIHKKIAYARFRYFLFPAVIVGENLEKEIKKINKSYTEYDLLSNLNYITLDVNKKIDKIVLQMAKNKVLVDDIKSGINYEYLKSHYHKESIIIKDFLKQYGWKSDYCCIPFSSTSWNEDPNRLLKILKISMSSLENESNDSNYKKYEYILKNLKANNKINKFNKLNNEISYYRLAHVRREESQYTWEKGFGLLRWLLTSISQIMSIPYEDLLYLRLNELQKVLVAEEISKKYKDIISHRKSLRSQAEITWEQLSIDAFRYDDKNVFHGVSGSLGKVRGKVRIVNNHNDFSKLEKGDILVCPYTDPEWTPLFKVAKAVVSDTGGALSHAAIVAREYGIPAVLGVGNATSNLIDGEYIVVDGDNGIIKKIMEE